MSARRQIKIKNQTIWRTDDLRALIRKACGIVFDPGQKTIIHVNIVTAKARESVTGCAYVGGTMMTLRIGREVTDLRMVGAIIVHELGHLRGLQHRDMRGGAKWTRVGVPTRDGLSGYAQWLKANEWVSGMQLRKKEVIRKERVAGIELIESRMAIASANLKRWESKAKRAANAIRKLRKRVKYYALRRAAMEVKGNGESVQS